MADILGTEGDDVLVGTTGPDNFIGLGGNDTITIGFGDSADGGTGTDSLSISLADHTEGVSFDTTGLLGAGPITLFGGTIRNFEILVAITGTAFSDYITVGTQATTLTINGGAGYDVVYGGGSAIVFNGGDDGDTFNSGSAADTFNGGAGTDMISYFSMNVGGTLTLGLNAGQAGSGFGGDVLIDVENVLTSAFFSFDDTVFGSNADNQISTYGGNDTIYGLGGNDSLQGGEGDDWIYGGTGDDLLRSEPGIDHLIGGEGSDTYFYGDGAVPTADFIVELVGDPGNDVLRLDPNGQAQIQDFAFANIRNVEVADLRTLADQLGFEFVLGAQFQAAGFTTVIAGGDIDASQLTTGASFALATPNIRDMIVLGGSGDDNFSFGDTLIPGIPIQNGQTFSLFGGGGYDRFRLSGGTFQEFYSGVGGHLLLSGLEEVYLVAGTAAQAVAGGPDIAGIARSATVLLTDGLVDAASRIAVNASALRANVVTGLGLDGELGGTGGNADTYSQERLTLDATALTGGRAVAATGGAAGDRLIGSAAADLLNGSGGHDVLEAREGDDQIDGGVGDDLITGGLGQDTQTGGSGSDTFVYATLGESASATRDIIADFQSQIDRIDLSNVDANTIQGGRQPFLFIGSSAFSGIAGQLRYSGGILAADTNGDFVADFEIELTGAPPLAAIDLSLNFSVLAGGTGDNRFHVSSPNFSVSLDGGAGFDTLSISGNGSFGSFANMEALDFQNGARLTLTAAQFKTGFAANGTLSGTGMLTITMALNDIELSLSQLTLGIGASITIVVNGSSGDDAIKGASQAANTLVGNDGADSLRGGQLADTISGGNGDDKIEGGQGADLLTGGAGADTFRYQSAFASGLGAAADRITDFTIGTDRLGFALIDADAVTPGDQAFSFLGTGAFANTGIGQIRYQTSGADLLVQADVNGDGIADMEIVLQGLAGQTLTGASFLL